MLTTSGATLERASVYSDTRSVTQRFRPEVQGLRALAILLVVIHHVWIGRVSGGVDVFLFLTGFFITGSLIRMVSQRGRIHLSEFLGRLLSRLVPTAAVVLSGTLLATFLFLPGTEWRTTIKEVVASALYFENWTLATSAVDYNSQNAQASALQHFWSLSIQGQFYLIWAAVITACLILAKRFRHDVRKIALLACALVFAVSITYSIAVTANHQAWAYFDTAARLWEFAVGGLVAPFAVHLPRTLGIAAGWLGVLALASCGVLVSGSTMFPGYAALWPVGAAALIVLAGTTNSRWGTDYWLTRPAMVRIGDLAYPLYLWHWPVLIVYLHITSRTIPSVKGGLAIIVSSLVLAAATRWVVQVRFTTLTLSSAASGRSMAVSIAFLAPVLIAAAAWDTHLDAQRAQLERLATDTTYPGAAALVLPELQDGVPPLPFIPSLTEVGTDLPSLYDEGCDADLGGSDAIICEYGPADAEHTIALVGASRVAHWFPAVHKAATTNGWRLINITKSGCQFSTELPLRDNKPFEQCLEWREGVMTELEELRPDLVMTSSTRALEGDESVYAGFLERWAELEQLGIDVLAVRDLPRLPFKMPECIAELGVENCQAHTSHSHQDSDPTRLLTNVPSNVTFTDLTDFVCPDKLCQPVIGNVLTYRDHSHLTATFAETLAPVVEGEIKAATGWD